MKLAIKNYVKKLTYLPTTNSIELDLKLTFLNYAILGSLLILVVTFLFRVVDIFNTKENPFFELFILIMLIFFVIFGMILLRTKYYFSVILVATILPLIGLLLYFPLYKNTTTPRISPAETIVISLILIGLILPQRYFIFSSGVYSIFLASFYIGLGKTDPLFILTRIIFIFWVVMFILISIIIRSKTFSSLKRQTAELKEKSESLEELNRSLDKKVNARTKELQFTNNELKEFAYVVSHDLKSPLGALTLMLSELASAVDSADNDLSKELFSRIFHNIDGMKNLVDGILKYSNISVTSSLDQVEKLVDLNKVIENIKGIIQPPKHIQILIPIPLPVVKFDETRLLQLFQNLITNAIENNDKKKGEISISYSVLESGQFEFRVKDNGRGIKPEDQERIFKLFEISGSRIENKHYSSGIGLAIVKKVVGLLGGEISIESTFSVGSTFIFTISPEFIVSELKNFT